MKKSKVGLGALVSLGSGRVIRVGNALFLRSERAHWIGSELFLERGGAIWVGSALLLWIGSVRLVGSAILHRKHEQGGRERTLPWGRKSLGVPSSLIEEEEGYWERTLASGDETSILGEGAEHTCLWGDRKTTPMSEGE